MYRVKHIEFLFCFAICVLYANAILMLIKFLNYFKQKLEVRKDMLQAHFVAYVV